VSQPWLQRAWGGVLMSLIPLAASAQDAPEVRCVQGDLQRRVAIFYETGVDVPCEVHYFKDTEAPGQREVLWRALSQSGYCESQAESFVDKLIGWGWICTASSVSGTGREDQDTVQDTVDEAPVDDTENLAPAGP